MSKRSSKLSFERRRSKKSGEAISPTRDGPEYDARGGISVRLACEVVGISQTGYRYVCKRRAENDEIADWLMRLTDSHRSWGFGLCYLYLRNVKGYQWNHKRIYRIYRDLELNLRIKPRKRLVRQAPEPLTVPAQINHVSVSYTHLTLPTSDWCGKRPSRSPCQPKSIMSGRWISCRISWSMAEASGCST